MLFLGRRHTQRGAQDLAHFFDHRPAVPGGAQAQRSLQLVVDATDQKVRHAATVGGDIIDINDIRGRG
jgi:hypothetical protein